ncbi:MAG: AI-2E family transporter [Oscillospiraceae bacterium]|nr:AI-2E family transporter [Oscillospiraceae bacterium]
MNFKWNGDDQKYIKLGLTAFTVVVMSILANQVLHQLPLLTEGVKTFLSCLRPIIYGLVFAYLLTPAVKLFEGLLYPPCRMAGGELNKLIRKVKPSKTDDGKKIDEKSLRIARGISIVLTWGLAVMFIAVLVKMVVPEVMNSVVNVKDNMPFYVFKFRRWISDIMEGNPEIRDWVMAQISNLYSEFNSLMDRLPDIMESLSGVFSNLSDFVGSLSTGVFSAVYGLFNVVIGVIVSIYVMGARETFIAQAKKVVYAVFPVRRANDLANVARLTHVKFGNFFVGKIIDSIIIGLLCFVLVSIFRIPYAVLISFIVGVTNIIPFFGPFIGAVPGAVLLILTDPLRCLYFLIIVVVLQQFDGNILGPKILGNSIGISSFWIMFSILVFGGMFGFWGLLCGVPLFAVIYELISDFVNNRLRSKKFSTVTDDYCDLNYIDAETGQAVNKKDKEDANVSKGSKR